MNGLLLASGGVMDTVRSAWGAVVASPAADYITVVCLIPEFLIVKWGVPFYFGGTLLLIIVVVTMDLISQVQSHLMSRQYESILKKSSLTQPRGIR